jgi:hypothetical protein
MIEKSQLPSRTRRPAAARPTSFRPALEALEDRMLLSSQAGITSAPALMAATAVHRAEVPHPVVGLNLDQLSTPTVIVMGKSAGDDWEARTSTVSVARANLGGAEPLILRRRTVEGAAVPNAREAPVEQISEIVITKPTDSYFAQSGITNLAHLQTYSWDWGV